MRDTTYEVLGMYYPNASCSIQRPRASCLVDQQGTSSLPYLSPSFVSIILATASGVVAACQVKSRQSSIMACARCHRAT